MSTLKKENHIIDVIDYHVIYYIYIIFIHTLHLPNSFNFLNIPCSGPRRVSEDTSGGSVLWLLQVANTRRSCLGRCYKMLKHTSEENMN